MIFKFLKVKTWSLAVIEAAKLFYSQQALFNYLILIKKKLNISLL